MERERPCTSSSHHLHRPPPSHYLLPPKGTHHRRIPCTTTGRIPRAAVLAVVRVDPRATARSIRAPPHGSPLAPLSGGCPGCPLALTARRDGRIPVPLLLVVHKLVARRHGSGSRHAMIIRHKYICRGRCSLRELSGFGLGAPWAAHFHLQAYVCMPTKGPCAR